MLTAIIVIIGLSLLILGHEAGHFVAAKLFKLRVDEFGFGFPPRMFAWRPKHRIKEGETLRQAQGETEYSFNWLPFGGFVKIAGENDQFDEQSEKPVEDERKRFFYAQTAWRRSVIILAGVFMNFLLGWVLLSAVLAMGIPGAVVVTGVTPSSSALAAGFKENDIIKGYTLVGDLTAEIQKAKTGAISVKVLRETGSVALELAGQGELGLIPDAVFVSKVLPDSPAESAGLREGDIVKGFSSIGSFILYVNANRGERIELELIRNGKTVSAAPIVRMDTEKGGLGVFLAGGTFLSREGLLLTEVGTSKKNIFAAIITGGEETLSLSWLTLKGFGSLIADLVTRASLQEGVVGPIGIFSFANQAGQFGFSNLLYLIAVISINLAVINLVPFPALDGGRFFLILLEKIKGSPISQKIEGAINTVGFALIILLMLALSVRDIAKLFL